MRIFLAISCLVALAAARPDVSHLGYNYHAGFSGTTASPTVIAQSNGVAIDATPAPTLAPLGLTSTVAPTYDLGLTSTIAPTYDLGLTSTIAPSLGYSGAFGFGGSFDSLATAIPSTISPLGLSAFGLGATSTLSPLGYNSFGLDASVIPSTIGALGYDGLAASGYINHQPPVVSKHFSFFSAPEEAREEYHRHLVLGTPQKSYRVVFIKAPASQTATRISASFAPKEEKTVIYVLSKKPEDLQINDIQAPQPTEPSKPEVFFIKYKTPEEAVHAQQQIQAQYDALGGYTQVNDGGVAPLTSVIGSLGQSVSEVDIANARFDTIHAPIQGATLLGAGAIHHLGSPLATGTPISEYSFGSLTSTFAPELSTISPFLSSFAPTVSTVAPSVGIYDSLVSTAAPEVSTIAPEKYLPPRKA